jgi:hypothetical protein
MGALRALTIRIENQKRAQAVACRRTEKPKVKDFIKINKDKFEMDSDMLQNFAFRASTCEN